MHRWHDAREIVEVLTPFEPLTTPIIASVSDRGTRRGVRVWRTGEDVVPAAVLCCARVCLDRWVAYVHETEPGAARELAPLLNRGPARRVCGAGPTVRTLLDDLAEVGTVTVLPFIAIPSPIPLLGDPEPNGRAATPADLGRLVELFRGERLEVAPTVPRLRRLLARAVRRGDLLVIEEAGLVVGAIRFDHVTTAYAWLDSLVVDPEVRGRRLSWRLTDLGARRLVDLGVGVAMTLVPTNPMRPRSDASESRAAMLQERPDVAANVRPWIDDPAADDVPTWVIARVRGRAAPRLVRRAWRVLELIEGPLDGRVSAGRLRRRRPGPAPPAAG